MRAEPILTVAPHLGGPKLMNQDWRDLAYLHWAVPSERVAHYFPPGVRPDTLAGVTYVGLVPFRMVDAGFGATASVPYFGTFLETNVRLYSVDDTGRRGVVFLSLDCNRLAVVAGARASLGLPYRWARMSYQRAYPLPQQAGAPRAAGVVAPPGTQHTYRARLRWRGVSADSTVRVKDLGPRPADELDHFVSARWGLHKAWLGRTLYIPNAHEPWPLHEAEVTDFDDGLLGSVGLAELAERAPDHVAFSPGVHTEFGLPVRATTPRESH